MINTLKNNKGSAVLWACVMVLSLLIIFSAIMEYFRLQLTAAGVRDAVQSAVIAVATQNYDEVYNGLREGYSGGYTLDIGNNWVSKVDKGAVMGQLNSLLDLQNGCQYSNGKLAYRISNMSVNIVNTPLAPGSNNSRFSAEVILNLEVPLSFSWEGLAPLKMKLKVIAGFSPKF